jgi:hypothetical protein
MGVVLTSRRSPPSRVQRDDCVVFTQLSAAVVSLLLVVILLVIVIIPIVVMTWSNEVAKIGS